LPSMLSDPAKLGRYFTNRIILHQSLKELLL
jgi:hypothetical protein